jgi:hypothetical protein
VKEIEFYQINCEILKGANMIHEKKTFSNETVTIDNNEYVLCQFEHCNLVYAATGSVGFQSCTFNDVKWEFSGAAQNTLSFMTALYHGGGQPIIEKTFENIRKGFHPTAKDNELW